MAKKKVPVPATKPTSTPEEFMALVNTSYKGRLISSGELTALKMKRLSSGMVSLDEALGGGWPFGKIVIVAGEYSTGKTLLALRACTSVEQYDHVTKRHKLLCGEDPFSPGRALFVDVENTFDTEWASRNGFNLERHMVAKPSTSEQTIDIISRAIEENVFDLIILDSIAQMTPSVEAEASAEDQQIGVAARMNNKAFRKWTSALAQRIIAGSPGPLLMCINQMRLNIGVMFGDPRTLPGGKGQTYASSVTIYTQAGTYDSKDEATMATVELKGVIYKNKTYKPKHTYAFDLGLTDTAELAKGEVNYFQQLVDAGKKFKLIKKQAGRWHFATNDFPSESALKAALKTHEALAFKLWRSIMLASTGTLV